MGKPGLNETDAPEIQSHEPSTPLREGASPVDAPWEPRCAPRSRVGSCGALHQIAHSRQVVRGSREGDEPAGPPDPTECDLPQQPHCVQPAEHLLGPFALLLTDRVAGVSRGPAINRTGPVRRVLGHRGRDL
jgi:hypothetical protein